MSDVRGELRQVNVQIAAMGQQVGALTTAVYSEHTRMDDFEPRLELRDVEPARP
jgi:hypothetical protein